MATIIEGGKWYLQVTKEEMQLVRGKLITGRDKKSVHIQVDLPVAELHHLSGRFLGPFESNEEAFDAQKKLAEAYGRWIELDPTTKYESWED